MLSGCFSGISYARLDAKGRVVVPSSCQAQVRKFQDENCPDKDLRFMLTASPVDRCLLLYPTFYWGGIQEKLVEIPGTKDLMIGYLYEILGLDSAGRVLIPNEHRDFAGFKLDKNDASDNKIKLVFVGVDRRYEIWLADEWTKHLKELRDYNRSKVQIYQADSTELPGAGQHNSPLQTLLGQDL